MFVANLQGAPHEDGNANEQQDQSRGNKEGQNGNMDTD